MKMKTEKFRGFKLEFTKKGGQVWTQIFKRGKLISSYISPNKTTGMRKGKNFLKKRL